jgi:hypothetical protein
MRKRLAILVLAAVVILVAVVPTLAAGPGAGGKQQLHERRMGPQPFRQNFALVGTITGLGGDTITVQVQSGNRLVKEYIGEQLTVRVTENTAYHQWTVNGCVPSDFGSISVGQTVSIQGVLIEQVYVAQRVTVDVPLECCTP